MAAANDAAEDASKAKTEALVEASAAAAKKDNAASNLVSVEVLGDDRKDSLACPFTFNQGVTKVVIPDGCMLLATNDITWTKQTHMAAPAVYFCTKASTPLDINEADLEKFGLGNSVSFIQPGESSTAEFYSLQDFKGSSAKFSSRYFKPLNSFNYHGGKSANDNVQSVKVVTTTSTIPDECKGLSFSSKMQLNTKLMRKDGKFF